MGGEADFVGLSFLNFSFPHTFTLLRSLHWVSELGLCFNGLLHCRLLWSYEAFMGLIRLWGFFINLFYWSFLWIVFIWHFDWFTLVFVVAFLYFSGMFDCRFGLFDCYLLTLQTSDTICSECSADFNRKDYNGVTCGHCRSGYYTTNGNTNANSLCSSGATMMNIDYIHIQM